MPSNRNKSENQLRFVVLGGGIIGLSCAVRLLEKYPQASAQIIGEHFSPNTTSDVAAGLWGPYVLGDTTESECRTWAQDTHDYMHLLWRSGQAASCGICLMPVIELFETEEPTPWWHDIVFGFQTMRWQPGQMEMLGQEYGQRKYRTGVAYVTFTCEPTKLMSYYRDILLARKVQFRQERLDNINSLAKLNIHSDTIIINCLGLGAQGIANDTQLCSVRGQVQKVKAAGVFHSFANNECYIIPNTETVTLGGTKQKSQDLRVCPIDRHTIKKNCGKIIPSLKNALLIRDAVGLRPVRASGVRLEVEYASILDGSSGKHGSTIVHNYGHGGAGITLAWGCAGEVVRLVEHEIDRMGSKL